MNKQRYLAELQQFLIFMTSADRAETLRRYEDLFDQAGIGDADALAARLGSPTKNAIRMSRAYEPGRLTDELLFGDLDLAPQPEADDAPLQPDPAPEADDILDFDLPPLDDLDASDPDEPGSDEPAGSAPGRTEAPEPRFVSVPLDEPEPAPKQERPTVYVDRSMPLWIGVPLFVLSLIVLALPLAVVCLALLPVLLIPGAAVLVCAYLAAVGGLWCTNYIADAAMLFGVAFLILGVALLVLWGGFRLDVGLVTLYIRLVRGLKGLFLGKKVKRHA